MDLWRLVPEARANAAFTGEGARKYGGRWNPPGASVVYLAEHLSLAALEIYVHLPRAALAKPYLAFRVSVPEAVPFEEMEAGRLPEDWSQEPPGTATQALGREWLDQGGRLLLAVPSVVVPQERNFLVNPGHLDWKAITIHPPEPFFFDSRMVGKE
jgi:RES domain-containing protein